MLVTHTTIPGSSTTPSKFFSHPPNMISMKEPNVNYRQKTKRSEIEIIKCTLLVQKTLNSATKTTKR